MKTPRHERDVVGVGDTRVGARLVALLGALALSQALMLSGVTEARAADRDRTIAVLESISKLGGDISVRAWVNDGAGREIAIGDPIVYHFVADRKSHLTVVHVDSHGVATLLLPNQISASHLLEPGVEQTFPAAADGFEIQAEPPVGPEFVLVLATATPIPTADLGISFDKAPVAVLEASAATAFADHLRERFGNLDRSERGSLRFEQRIRGRSDDAEYTSSDIVSFFETRTRSIRQPRLDLHVRFATGSDVLDEVARQNLDEVADALQNRRMAAMRFNVNGHTDDVGDTPFNDALSRRRAESVVKYLTQVQGIAPERFEIRFYGERQPLETGTSEEARRVNRRVEFELIR
jgi:outer membrane protein OmpA-like peptidoglycan-associated protein